MNDLDLFGDYCGTRVILGKGQEVVLPFEIKPFFSKIMMDLYDNFNQITFDEKIQIDQRFEKLCRIVYDVFGQKAPDIEYKIVQNVVPCSFQGSNDVLLAFSGGLDSCYQAICLMEKGYNVHLFHVKGIHAYEGNAQLKAVESFSKKMGMDVIYASWKRIGKKGRNKYYQMWGDNAIKNQLIEEIMIDICTLFGWNKISLGDDESISVYDSDAKCGINITDCVEVQRGFVNAILAFCDNLEYIGIERPKRDTSGNKYARIKKLDDYGLSDCYYSCVGAGRFNKYNHDVCEKKYGIKLHRYNCGCYCTKCSIHNLLLYYVGNVDFPMDFVSRCWERLWNTKYGNFSELFGKDVPLERRIENLLTY